MEPTTKTKAERILEVLEGQRLFEDVPPVKVEEVKAGRRVADWVHEAARLGGLPATDARVLLVCLNKLGKLERKAYTVENADANDLLLMRDIAKQGWQPAGIVICLLDRERRTQYGPGAARAVPLVLHWEIFEGMDLSRDLMRGEMEKLEAIHKAGDTKLLN